MSRPPVPQISDPHHVRARASGSLGGGLCVVCVHGDHRSGESGESGAGSTGRMGDGSSCSTRTQFTAVPSSGSPRRRSPISWNREIGSDVSDASLAESILAAAAAVKDAYASFGPATDTLAAKVLLGTLACEPACDRIFIQGFQAAGPPVLPFQSGVRRGDGRNSDGGNVVRHRYRQRYRSTATNRRCA